MTRCLLCLTLLLCTAYASARDTAPLQLTDDAGRRVELPAPARRIVSLAPHVTELLFAAGAGDRVVGVDEFSDFPEAAAKLPRIGRHSGLDLEAIVALRPDLVIGWASGNRMPQLDRLEALGIPLYLNEIREIDDIATSLETFGRLAGTPGPSAEAATALRARNLALARRAPGRAPLRVFYQIWDRPPMTVNGEHLISRAITLCGGQNAFTGLPQLAPVISEESVLAAAPQAIVVSATRAGPPAWLEMWKRWPQLPAVAAGNLLVMPPDVLQRPTPRFIDGIEALCALLDSARGRLASDAQADSEPSRDRR